MDPHHPTAGVVRFGVFELDARSGELRRHGLKIRLPHQSFQILRLLLRRPGEVVTREELRQAVWTSETFVDFDVGLNSAIRKLREALDDSAEDPRFVETLPRRGYRFIVSVEPPAEGPPAVDPPGVDRIEPEPESSTLAPPDVVIAASRLSGLPGRAAWIAGGLVLTAAIAALAVVYARGGFVRLRAGTASAPVRSLAVLPFENLTGDAAQSYFVDGVTDALTTHLAQVDGLEVVSRTSARQYKQPNKRLPAIAEELKVDAVLEGAVARSGDRVRISAQLVHAATDRHVWARSYEDAVSHILPLQQRIASEIASAVGRRGAPSGGARGRQPVDPEAYDAYLKGLTAMGSQRYEGFRTAVAYFEQAVAKQPDFAEAHAALARTQVQFLFDGPLSPREIVPKAEAAARKAIELDDTLAAAHRTLGQILTHFYWKWDEGDKEFQRAAELSPGVSEPTAGTQSLIRSGRVTEAVAEAERARTRDPESFNAQLYVAIAYRAAGQHERAIAELRRALERRLWNTRVHFQLGITYVEMGRLDDAIRELETAVQWPRARDSRIEGYLGYAYAAAGRPSNARRILRGLESLRREQYVSSFGIALIYDALGEKAPALAAIERAYEERAVEFAQMTQYPAFTTLASEPGFQAVLRLIGLPR